jgi:hypothetical protein
MVGGQMNGIEGLDPEWEHFDFYRHICISTERRLDLRYMIVYSVVVELRNAISYYDPDVLRG